MQNNAMTDWEKQALKIEHDEWRELATSIAITVLELLDQNSMTKQQLAEKMGVKPQYVSRVVKGQANMTLDTIAKLERALGETIITVSDPTSLVSATSVIISPKTQWQLFFQGSVTTAINSKKQSGSECFENEDNYALAS